MLSIFKILKHIFHKIHQFVESRGNPKWMCAVDKSWPGLVWWCMPLIPMLGGQRQEDLSYRPVRAT